MWDVLDHVNNPLEELKEVYRILKPNEILLCRVRNASFHFLMLKLTVNFPKLNKIIYHPWVFHNYSFNTKTLKLTLKKTDFYKVKIKNSALTIGDPYNQSKLKADILQIIKFYYWIISKFIELLTQKQILISPSIVAYAKIK